MYQFPGMPGLAMAAILKIPITAQILHTYNKVIYFIEVNITGKRYPFLVLFWQIVYAYFFCSTPLMNCYFSFSSGHSGALPPLSGEDRYRMNHSKRGFAIIINNTKFDPQTRMSERKGSDLDASNLYQQFKALGFDATLLNNIKSIEMQRCMDKGN